MACLGGSPIGGREIRVRGPKFDARTKQETRSALPSPVRQCAVRQGLDTIIDSHFDELGRGAVTHTTNTTQRFGGHEEKFHLFKPFMKSQQSMLYWQIYFQ